jgi:hypothetical protein
LPDAYRRGVLRQLDLNFLRSLAKKPDLAVAESALRIAKQDRAMLGGLPTSVLRRVVSFVTSQGFGDMPEEFLFTPAWTAAASQRAAESAAVVAHLAAGLPPKHPLAHLLEACGSKVTDRGCASSVVHLLESLVDLTPVVDSVEAALLNEHRRASRWCRPLTSSNLNVCWRGAFCVEPLRCFPHKFVRKPAEKGSLAKSWRRPIA